MAVGGPQQSLNIPSPSELAGGSVTPAVTPSAVTQMSEALRSGFLNADDIIARTGKRAQLKEKADVLALQRQMSPETLAAEDVMRKAAVTKAQGVIDVAPGEIARAQAENKMAADVAEAGVGFSDVAKNLASAGQQIPRTPEGKIDVSAAFSESANIDRWKAAQAAATANLPAVETIKYTNGAEAKVPWDKLTNRQISDAERDARYATLGKTANYNVWKASDLFGPTPGQVVAAPTDEPPAPMIEPDTRNVDQVRADLMNRKVIGEGAAGAAVSDEEVLRLSPPPVAKPDVMPAPVAVAAVAPAAVATPTPAPAASSPTAGVGSSVTKEAPINQSALSHYTETQQKALGALTRGLATEATLLNKHGGVTGFDPASLKSQARMEAYKGGIFSQMFANLAGITEPERAYANAAGNWVQGLLRAESGAAIATKEQAWYERTFFPALGDTPAVQAQKDNFRRSLMQTFEQVVQGKMTPEQYATFRDTISSQAVTPGGFSDADRSKLQTMSAAPVTSGAVVTDPATGIRYTKRGGAYFRLQ